MSRRRPRRAFVALMAALSVAPLVRGQDVRQLDRALVFLARQQRPDGTFSDGPGHLATTSRAALAFLSAGQPPGSGRFALVVSRAYDALAAAKDDPGADVDVVLALSQLLGVDPSGDRRERVKATLTRKVSGLCAAQEPGGAFPASAGDDAYVATARTILSLRAAERAGIAVSPTAMSQAVAFLSNRPATRPVPRGGAAPVTLALLLSGVAVAAQPGGLQLGAGDGASDGWLWVAVLAQRAGAQVGIAPPKLPEQSSDGAFAEANARGEARARDTANAVLTLTAPSGILPAFRP